MIEFVEKEVAAKDKQYFADVGRSQFFVCTSGFLCQKIDLDSYNIIADSSFNPLAERIGCAPDARVKEIKPEIIQIKF